MLLDYNVWVPLDHFVRPGLLDEILAAMVHDIHQFLTLGLVLLSFDGTGLCTRNRNSVQLARFLEADVVPIELAHDIYRLNTR